MVRKPEVTVVNNLRGGEGAAEIHHILSKDELRGHGKMYAKVVLHPHCGIGYHLHEDEYEPIFVLSGKGIFTDNFGNETEVFAGDVCTMEPNEKHSIRNASETEDLVIIGLVLNA